MSQYFWHASLNGKWVVLQYRTDVDAHRVVAECDSEERAAFYAQMDNERNDIRVEKDGEKFTDLGRKEIKQVATRIGVNEGSEQIKADLAALFEEFPEGFTVALVQQRYRYTYNSALEILRHLHGIGAGQFVYKNGTCGAKIFVANDVEVVAAELTFRQRAVLGAMKERSDRYNLCSMTANEIAVASQSPFGSVPATLYALQKKGKIALAKPAGAHGPATYQVIEATSANQGLQ